MNKFDPNKVPSWCRWIAVDENGECWAFSSKPVHMITGIEWWPSMNNIRSKFHRLYKGKPPKNWKDELYTWG